MYGLYCRESLSKKQTHLHKTKNSVSTEIVSIENTIDSDDDLKQSDIKTMLQQQMKDIELINNKLSILIKHFIVSEMKNNEYVPYYIKEDFVCCDNKTLLRDNVFTMVVELLGYMEKDNLIYPFGNKKISSNFTEQKISLKYKDNDMLSYDNMLAKLMKRDDIYVIEILDVYSKEKQIELKKLTFPVTVRCDNIVLFYEE